MYYLASNLDPIPEVFVTFVSDPLVANSEKGRRSSFLVKILASSRSFSVFFFSHGIVISS